MSQSTAKRYRRCILATLCVPWNERFEFEEDTFRRLVRHLKGHGIRDLYTFGTAGEGHAVTERQFDEITRVFLDEAKGDGMQTMTGLISQSLPTVIERIERARDMGEQRFQISLPGWGVLKDKEVEVFFRETCGRFPDCEFLHYNLMRTGRIITGTEYGRLAAQYPNLVATKNSTADEPRLQSLMYDAPQLQHFITEQGFAKASMMGECGFLISVASIDFSIGQRYLRAGIEQDSATLNAMAQEFSAVIAALKELVGDTAHMDGAFDKVFCRLGDPAFPLRLLPPYASTSVDACASYAARLRTDFPHWLSSNPQS